MEQDGDESFREVPFHTFSDYQILTRTLQALEAQHLQADNDLQTLHAMHRDALADPSAFVLRLLAHPPVRMPERQKIVSVPALESLKADALVKAGAAGVNIWDPANASQKFVFGHSSQPPETQIKAVPIATASSTVIAVHEVREASVPPSEELELQPPRPVTFNQLWTPEEHARLVELLEVYPEEEVQAQRWDKIAKALGSRTSRQVASRTQKYFQRLQQAGLPIPGSRPHAAQSAQNKADRASRKKQRTGDGLEGAAPTVYMSDDESGSDSDKDVDEETKQTEEYKELRRLRKLRKKKEREQVVSQRSAHFGFKCDGCGMEPILGVRWTCEDASCADMGVDLCAKCKQSGWEGDQHKLAHEMSQHGQAESDAPLFYVDSDYVSFGNQSNYLDPNYQPAHLASQPP